MSSEGHHNQLWLLNDRRQKLDASSCTSHVCTAAEFNFRTDIHGHRRGLYTKERLTLLALRLDTGTSAATPLSVGMVSFAPAPEEVLLPLPGDSLLA